MDQHGCACPRCGYDLSGVAASWQESCSLDGICSECGLRFFWRDLFHRSANRVPGFVEHSRGLFQFLRWSFRTWGWMIRPDRFWSRVRLEHSVMVGRLLGWLLVVLGLCYGAPVALGIAWRTWELTGFVPPQRSTWDYGAASTALAPFQVLFSPSWRYGPGGITFRCLSSVALPVGAFSILFPTLVLLIPATRRVARVQWTHVLRASVYGLAWLPPLLLPFLVIPVIEISSRYNVLRGLETALSLAAEWPDDHWLPIFVVTLAWECVWWLVVLKRGFRLENGVRIWAVLVIPASLAVIILLLLDIDFLAAMRGLFN